MNKLTVIAEPGKQEIVMTRMFDAPRDLVFRAFTDAELLAQWWGQDSTTTIIDKMEAKPGGLWRFVQHEPDGNEYAFHGVFHSIEPNERLIYTFEFEGMPGHVLLETVTFEEHDGKTKVIDLAIYQSVADRDGMVQAGMESGAAESYDRLDALLVKTR